MDKTSIPEDLKEYTLQEHSFFDNTLSMQFPDFMKPLSPDEYQKRFWGALKPDFALSSASTGVLFIFSKSTSNTITISIEDYIKNERAVFTRIVPGYAELGSDIQCINGLKVGSIQYKSNAIDKDLINVFFALIIDGTVGYGLFVAPFNLQEIWRRVFLSCIESLKQKRIEK